MALSTTAVSSQPTLCVFLVSDPNQVHGPSLPLFCMLPRITFLFGMAAVLYGVVDLQERPHVVACFLLGVAAMIYPLNYLATHGHSDSSEE